MTLKPILLVLALGAAPVAAKEPEPGPNSPPAPAQPAPTQPAQSQPVPVPGGRGGKFFDATDTNKDGAISQAEWTTAGRKPEGFATMDLNKDGKVTREEGRAAMQKVMQARSLQQPEN